MRILTNNRPRPLVSWHDLPEKERGWDYLSADERHTPRFVNYRGSWYDCMDMMLTDVSGWDAAEEESYFSGVLVRLVNRETVIMGRWHE